MKTALTLFSLALVLSAVAVYGQSQKEPAQPSAAKVVLPTDRTVLPIPEPMYPNSTEVDAKNAAPPPRFEVSAPAGAPNVLIVLVDDMGFG